MDSQLLNIPSVERPWSTRQNLRFGGLPIPGSGVVMGWLDLNDEVSWHMGEWQPDGSQYIAIQQQQLSWQAAAAWTGTDFRSRTITVPMLYVEQVVPFSRAIAQLVSAGEQYLTTDNVTGVRCKYTGYGQRTILNADQPYIHQVTLTFQTREPFAEVIAGDAHHGFTGTGDAAGVYTDVYVDNPGSVFSPPQLYLTLSGPASSVLWSNVGEGVAVAVNTPSAARVVDFQTRAYRVFADTGELPPVGTFPMVFAGTNHFQVYVRSPAPVTLTGDLSFRPKLELP